MQIASFGRTREGEEEGRDLVGTYASLKWIVWCGVRSH